MVDPRLRRQRPHHARPAARARRGRLSRHRLGHGAQHGRHAPTRCERLAERIEAFGEGGKVILVGWSLGGVFAREVAKVRPDLVEKVVTLGSPFSGDPRGNNVWRLYEWIAGHPVDKPPIETDARRKAAGADAGHLVARATASSRSRSRARRCRARATGRSSSTAAIWASRSAAAPIPAIVAAIREPSRPRNGAATSGGTRSGRPRRLVEDRPGGPGPHPGLAVVADELDMAVEARALGRLADPGAAGHRLAGPTARR